MGIYESLFGHRSRHYHQEEPTMEYIDVESNDGERVKTIIEKPFNDPIIKASPAWKKMKVRFESFLDGCGIAREIDEVALMFTDELEMFDFLKAAVAEPGVKLFNYATDHVRTHPIPSEYWVEYCFLEVEDLGMRVEVMHIDRGMSPLHETLGDQSYLNPTVVGNVSGPVVVHYSFKVPRGKYEETRAAMVAGRAELAQACESGYGHFAYYRLLPGANGVRDWPLNTYLKPRINLRDPETFDAPNTTDRGEFGMPGVGRAGRPITDNPQA